MESAIEVPHALSGKYKGTFAYLTIKDRLPIILTKVVDACHKKIEESKLKHGEDGRKDAIEVVGKLSKLRNEIMTDKPLYLLDDKVDDVILWNERFEEYRKSHGNLPSWFTASWLYVECFLYRRIFSILKSSMYMMEFDPFVDLKKQSLQQSMAAVENLSRYLLMKIETFSSGDAEIVKQSFFDFIQISLWGNKCDLSLSAGVSNSQNLPDPHKNLETFFKFILVNHIDRVWNVLCTRRQQRKQVQVDIVLDNSGFELFTDLILCEFLLSSQLADVIVFHPKAIPWFVSDVTPSDFHWTLDFLVASSVEVVSQLATRWKQRLCNGSMTIVEDRDLLLFWSLPDPFYLMQSVSPDLYKKFTASDLVLFKGDLNYRKLVGDLDWPHETPFNIALRGFTPTNLCSLRTLKANVVVGLKERQAENTKDECEDWMVLGKYAVIQYEPKPCHM